MAGFECGQSSPYGHQLQDYRGTHDKDQKSDNSESKGTSSYQTRKPRGRPTGSKNKPKPPIIISQDSPNSLQSHILEILPGEDIVKCMMDYAKRRGRGVSVICGSGSVVNVTLRGTVGPASGIAARLAGRFDITQLCGTILPPPAPPGSGGLTIYLTGPQAQIIGGLVAGPLMVAGTVVLMVASFANAVFERLPLGEEEEKQEEPTAVSSTSGRTSGENGGSYYNWGLNSYQFPGDRFGSGGNDTRPF